MLDQLEGLDPNAGTRSPALLHSASYPTDADVYNSATPFLPCVSPLTDL